MSRQKSLNLTQIQTVSIRKRNCLLNVETLADMPDPAKSLVDFYRSLPRLGAAAELINAADALAQTALAGKDTLWLIDNHLIDAGLSPLIVRLIHRGLIKAIAMTGTAAVRDYELAFYGVTNEDVKGGLEDGLLGMGRETAEGMNEIINEGVKRGFSLGECLGRGILDRQPKYYSRSILAACAARLVTHTIHTSVGSDGFHCHPSADGAMIGKGSLKDLQILAGRIDCLNEGGALVATHRSSALQEVFTHAYALAKNLGATMNQFSLLRFGEDCPSFDLIPGISAEFDLSGPIELIVPLFTGVLFSLVE